MHVCYGENRRLYAPPDGNRSERSERRAAALPCPSEWLAASYTVIRSSPAGPLGRSMNQNKNELSSGVLGGPTPSDETAGRRASAWLLSEDFQIPSGAHICRGELAARHGRRVIESTWI